MSTPTGNESLGERKAKHLEICVDSEQYSVEGGVARFDDITLVHQAMPEISLSDVDPSIQFLGYTLPAPLFLSCMTGGSESGFQANKDLARAAQSAGIPVGMGSIRILFEEPQLIHQFQLKREAPDVPVIANIGAVQLPTIHHGQLFELCKQLEVDALAVHMNPGQELFQPDGDTDFRGLKDAFSRLCDQAPIAIIAKETGCGMTPNLVKDLISRGAAYVDIAGSGGTNWITVESYRAGPALSEPAADFKNWGIPTALTLAAVGYSGGKIIASGGIRSGLDAAKAVAIGAQMVGSALPFIRRVKTGGQQAVEELIATYLTSFKAAMLLTGSNDIAALRTAHRYYEPSFAATLASFSKTMG